MSGLPFGWRQMPLESVAQIQGGIQKQPKRAPKLNRFPFLRVANVTTSGLELREVHEVELFGDELERLRLLAGDLLVVEGNGSASQIGRAAVWDGSIKDCVHQNHLIRVRPGKDLLPRFLGLVWNSPAIREELSAVSSSTSGLHTLSVSKLKRLHVPVPPLDEQRRIVDMLEDHLSRLDAARKYLQQGAKRLTALRLSAIGSSAGGEIVELGELAVESRYGTSTKCAPNGAGKAVVRIPNLLDGRIDLKDEKRAIDPGINLSGLLLRTGDVLIVRTNGSKDLIGRAAVVHEDMDAAFASYLIRYRLDRSRILPAWLRLVLETPRARRELERMAASSAGQHNLGLKKLDSLRIPTPPLATQRAQLRRLADLESSEASLRDFMTAARRRLEALRHSLLDAAFSGQFTGDSRDLDRAEEIAGG